MSQAIEESADLFLQGGSRAIILAHAYTGSINDVRMLGNFLHRQGYTVYLPMFQGHGTNQPENILAHKAEDWQKDIENSLLFLKKQGIKEIAIFGLSLGGVYAMRFLAEEHPEIIGGGSFCSPLLPNSKNNILPVFLQYARQLVKKTTTDEMTVRRRMENIDYLLQQQLKDIQQFQEIVFKELAQIDKPTLLIQAGADELIDAQAVFEAEKEFKKTVPQLKWYSNSGHVVTIGPDRQQLQEDVLMFVNGLDWAEEKE